ncbi:MAG: homoserine O-acetyltransferase, partial [Candidatus Aminicenantes bacterium]|nr:homoserine O-acetyltransferase [Candidatus Aminicenantes bacterium]
MSEYSGHAAGGASVGVVEKRFFTFGEPPGELILESGRRLGPVTIAYETYGRLDKDAGNAVIVFHALSGNSHAAGVYSDRDEKPGWWDNMVGPGKGI